MKTAIFVAIRAFALSNSRLLLMRRLIAAGWRVVAATVEDGHYTKQLSEQGIVIAPVPFKRGGLSPIEDLRAFWALIRIYRKYRPTLAHHFHGKPIILGNLAARFVKNVKAVNTITGLGYAALRGGLMRDLFVGGYRLLEPYAQATIFQNPDDRDYLLQEHCVRKERSHLIIGSGVDTTLFKCNTGTNPEKPLRVLMVARLVWMKGVREYVEAAKLVKQEFPQVIFQYAGDWDHVHPDAVPERWLNERVEEGTIEYLGYLKNMKEFLTQIDLCVLPSYREGTPRVLLEAAACGIPVVTTNVPGCRETIMDGETGLLVPPRNSQALARAISELLANPDRRRQMGYAGRQRVEREFDLRVITEKQLTIYRQIGVPLEEEICVL